MATRSPILTMALGLALLASCSGDGGGSREPGGTCMDSACGGSPVGTWDLVDFCATDDTVSVAPQLTFTDDGQYGYTSAASGNSYTGTWEVDASGKLVITVNGASSSADFCAGSELFWWKSGALTVVRRRSG